MIPTEILHIIFSFILPRSSESVLASGDNSTRITSYDVKDYISISHASSQFRNALFSYTPITIWLCSPYLSVNSLFKSMRFLRDPFRAQSITILSINMIEIIEDYDIKCSTILFDTIKYLSSTLRTLSIKMDCIVLLSPLLFTSVLKCSKLTELELIGYYPDYTPSSFTKKNLEELTVATPLLRLLSIEQCDIGTFSNDDLFEIIPFFINMERINVTRFNGPNERRFPDVRVGNVLVHYQDIIMY